MRYLAWQRGREMAKEREQDARARRKIIYKKEGRRVEDQKKERGIQV